MSRSLGQKLCSCSGWGGFGVWLVQGRVLGGKYHSPQSLCACLCTHVMHAYLVITFTAWSVTISVTV